MKPESYRKLLEWEANALRKGLDPADIKLYISDKGLKTKDKGDPNPLPAA